ncbi:MAG: TetR/AcrR family transcriptional regulator [Spirochaetaceae bacterium]|nr:MAG: TetR/AcrR family transcriptional regulator [Spirochaetaceae bacterium]
MHITKDYDVRKAEFLDTAMRLFIERGYDDTSVNAIIDAVGVSKGAFYHYFKTKEELLDELAARAGDQAMAIVEPIVADPALPAIEKMNAMFARTNAFKAQNRELMITLARVFYSDRNALLRSRMTRRSVELTAPALARIIEQGNREGTMDVTHPAQTAAMILEFGATVVAGFARRLEEIDRDPAVGDELILSMRVYTESVERMLGVTPGSLTLVDDSIVRIVRGDTAESNGGKG